MATSVGMIPHVCAEVLNDSIRWREMVKALATVPTQSLQLWLRKSELDLGWRQPGAAVSGYKDLFDTYASMTHLALQEHWPEGEQPRTIGYFCGVLPTEHAADPRVAHRVVRSNAIEFLNRDVGRFWPRSVAPSGGFQWELLCSPGTGANADALDGQYWKANVDPSDQYVQSLPGTGKKRLRADQSGYRNLHLGRLDQFGAQRRMHRGRRHGRHSGGK